MHSNAKPLVIKNSISVSSPDWSETCLQSLNRRVGEDKLLLVKELFEQTVDLWAGIPVIFQEEGIHPDFDLVDIDVEQAAEAVGGRRVGSVQIPRIEVEGRPRLMASIDDVKDERVKELFEKGELGLSTGFKATHDGDRMTSAPIPNHVLLFREIPDVVEQGDPGAFVHTIPYDTPAVTTNDSAQEETPVMLDELNNSISEELSLYVETPEEKNMADPEFPKNEPADTTAELAQKDAEIASLTAQLAEATARAEELQATLTSTEEALAAAKQELEAYYAAENDRKFSELLEQLPEGMAHTDELKHSIRKEFETDPIAAVTKILKAQKAGGETRPIGDRFANSNNVATPREIGNLSPHALKLEQTK